MSPVPKHPWYSASGEKLILMRLPPVLTNDEVVAGTAAMEQYFNKTPSVSGWIVDLSDVSTITATQRKLFAENEKRIAHVSTKYISRCAYVAPNTLVRSLLTAFFWMWQPPYPHRVFSDRAAAEAWALGTEREARLHPHP